MAPLSSTPGRRDFLRLTGAAAVAVGLRPRTVVAGSTATHRSSAATALPAVASVLPATHLVWVWQFSTDGKPEAIRETLAAHGLGIALKTHDGVEWMSRYDRSGAAVSGPRRVAELAEFFEDGGVPFHAWAVVQGVDVAREASMAAQVLGAGARTISLDLESYRGFWSGTTAAARQYGELLRAAQPDRGVLTTIDARPWEMDRIPLKEFAAFSDAIAPQVYWPDFSTAPNVTKYWIAGEIPDSEGVTARFALDVAAKKLQALRLPIHPIGPGLVKDRLAWSQFIERSFAHEARSLSTWRFGTTAPEVFAMLRDTPPRIDRWYTVQPGDTLGHIAAAYGTSVPGLMKKNGLTDPDYIWAGQRLLVPA